MSPGLPDGGTVHLVYPHGERISCPDAIGRELATRLSRRHEVRLHDWSEFGSIRPRRGDVLLGHACPIPGTVFRRSLAQPGWSRILLLSPHCHGDDWQPAYNDRIVPHCDLYLAITGRYWFEDLPYSGFAHWLPKMRHLDLAVERQHFPVLKTRFNPPGERRFVYVGSNAWYKNVPYLVRLARAVAHTEFAWAGARAAPPPLRALGWLNMSSLAARQLLSGYDFMITVGSADGNPTTILEAMAWGLIPVATPQSGYVNERGIPNLPLNDVAGAVEVIDRLQSLPEEELVAMQRHNWERLDERYNWDRFASQVEDAIASRESPPIQAAPIARRLALRWAELTSPYWRDLADPRKLRRRVRKSLGGALSDGGRQRA